MIARFSIERFRSNSGDTEESFVLKHNDIIHFSMSRTGVEELYEVLEAALSDRVRWSDPNNDVRSEGFDQRFADERLGYAIRVAIKSVLREETKSRFHPE